MKSFLLSALLASTALAADLTIQSGPLEASLSIDGTFLPLEATVLQINPQQWATFKITEVVPHGAAVKEGDPLITFESEDYQRALAESKEAAKSRKLALATAEQELKDLKVSTPQSIADLKLAHDRAKEDLDDFTKSGRALSEESAKERLEEAKLSLSYYEEELKQLLKMYEEDGNTEETEEIILTRQRAAVKSARFALKKAEKSASIALETTLPRKALDLQRSYEKALTAYETGKINLPRALAEKTLALAKTKRDHAEEDRKLAELEADEKLLALLAPADGTIYYGEINGHAWTPGDTEKFLVKNGAAPADTALVTLIPADRILALHGKISQADRLALPMDAKGSAEVEGLENATYPVTLTTLAGAPDASDNYPLAMTVKLPEESPIVPGMKAKIKLVTYQKEEAISIPNSAITTKDGVSTVEVKMADGKNEVREVQLGRRVGDDTEILEGLEVDQVILVPDPPKK